MAEWWVVLGASALTGIAATLVALVTTRAAQRSQAESLIARREDDYVRWLRDERAEAYFDLLLALNQLSWGLVPADDEDSLSFALARVQFYGSPEVGFLLLHMMLRFESAAQRAEASDDSASEGDPVREWASEASSALLELVRDELDLEPADLEETAEGRTYTTPDGKTIREIPVFRQWARDRRLTPFSRRRNSERAKRSHRPAP